jgi:O-acetyl-ADP-ribose deacetylase (regulator of RNase III)
MKIQYIQGDLFQTEIKTIAHGCNAQGVMGSGVAKIIREKYPKAYQRYRNEYEKNNTLHLGTIITVPCRDHLDENKVRVIVNAITQKLYGRDGCRYVSYDAVVESMQAVNRLFEIYGISEVAMPKIGAGLANGKWEIIERIIETELINVKPYVYILE